MAHTGFGLNDFYQKVLPISFREGQKIYLGKKGMSLHVDILFFEERRSIDKTCIFHCHVSM